MSIAAGKLMLDTNRTKHFKIRKRPNPHMMKHALIVHRFDIECQVSGFDSLKNYYQINLKRHNALKQIFEHTSEMLLAKVLVGIYLYNTHFL